MTTPVAFTPEVGARLKAAVLGKAVRIYSLREAPLGTHGEMTEYGIAVVRPDWNVSELLAGLTNVNWDTDLDMVTADDVIRAMGYELASIPEAKVADIENAILAARSWVASYILGGVIAIA